MIRALMKASYTGLALFAFVIPFLRNAVGAAEQPRERIRIVYVTFTGNHLSGWVAQEGGFFRKQGLEVELVNATSGATAVRTLLSGDAQFAQTAGPAVLESDLQGSANLIIAGLLNTLNYQFVTSKEIRRPDQLRGKTVAINRLGSSSDFATRYALERYGLTPGKDVTIVEIGNEQQRFSALTEGKIQGLLLAMPISLKARQMGFPTLIDLGMLGFEYPALVLAATQATIKSRADLVRKVLTAYVEGIHYLKTHPKEAMMILRKYLGTGNTEELRETYESTGLNLTPEKPYPTLKGIQNVLREFSAKYPGAQTARPEQFINSTALKELDRSGFIERLYKDTPVALPTDRK
jgi:NitT/TauT family transport system substrate-binding protein